MVGLLWICVGGNTEVTVKLFELARQKASERIKALKPVVDGSHDAALKEAYPIALIMADSRNVDDFINGFPETAVMDIYENIELKKLTPSFLFSVLGRLIHASITLIAAWSQGWLQFLVGNMGLTLA